MDWNENQLKEPRLIDIPIAHDQRGNLSVVEGGELIPFDIKRLYNLYDVPGGTSRGGHAHRNLRQLIIAASGSFDVILDDGKKAHQVFAEPFLLRTLHSHDALA